jgi:hypothetical protein
MIDVTYYLWVLLFGVFAYICIIDENVIRWCYLMLQLIRINVIRFFWGNKMRLGLEISRWKMKRDMKKFLKEKQLEVNENANSENT